MLAVNYSTIRKIQLCNESTKKCRILRKNRQVNATNKRGKNCYKNNRRIGGNNKWVIIFLMKRGNNTQSDN